MTGLAAGGLAAATAWAVVTARDAWVAAPARARLARLRPSLPPTTDADGSWLGGRLADAGFAGPTRRWATAWIGSVAALVLLATLAGGAGLAVLAMTAGLAGPWLALAARRGRSAAAIEAALPPVLETTARGMRAGASLPMALAAAASGTTPALASDLAALASEASDAGLVAALDGWSSRRPLPGVRLAAAALALAAELGGGGARALDGVALTLRQRQAVAGEVRALATQARLSATVLTVAPVAFAALAAAGDPRTAEVLLRSPVGQVCLSLGLGLDAVGAAWMARITRSGAS